jgi:biopolymer transport protein ExbD
MPSVKIPRKSTDFDMTPFVDVAFLILSFFMLATKFKPPDVVEIKYPNSVSSKALEEKDGILITIDKDGRVFFTMQTEKKEDDIIRYNAIKSLNQERNLGLTDDEMKNFVRNSNIGLPFSKVKPYLALTPDQQKNVKQEGIPVRDSANNELYWWVKDAVSAFSGKKINYLVKGDNSAKYPDFKNVLSAFKRNDIYKFQLITAAEDAPPGTELYKERHSTK